MRIPSEQLGEALDKGLRPIYVVHGAEPLLALEAADRIRQAGRAQQYSEREVLTVETGFKWGELLAAGRSQSLFATRKLLELRVPTGKPGVEGAAALVEYASIASEDVLLLVSLPKLDRQQIPSGWMEALDQRGVIVEAQAVERARLPRWIGERLQRQGQSADPATLQFLADRVEGNLLAAFQEIQKLALVFPRGQLRIEDIESAVLDVARYDTFKLTESLAAGDAARFARSLRGLREEGEAPPLVLWVLTEEIRAWLNLKLGQASGRPLQQLFRENRVWGPRQRSVEQLLPRIKVETLESALLVAAQCDRLVKGLRRGDVWDGLLQLGLTVMGRSALRLT